MPVPYAATIAPNEGAWRFSGMWGAAYRDGRLLMEVTEVTGQLTRNRIDVPLVGRDSTGHKKGRVTRDGSLVIQKIDSKWEIEIWQGIVTTIDARRAARDANQPISTAFSLQVEYDDPDALGMEVWRLNHVQLWDVPIGFNIGDDLVNRQFTMTWESEEPIKAFAVQENTATGVPSAHYLDV